MKFIRSYKGNLGAMCSRDPYNVKLLQPYLDTARSVIVATDGHICCAVPVQIEDGELSGPIPKKALERFLGGSKRKPTLHCGDVVKLTFEDGEQAIYPRKDLTFVKYDQIFPQATEPPTLHLDADLLRRLSAAMDADSVGVALWIKDKDSAVLVGTSANDTVGVLMPMRGHTTAPSLPRPKETAEVA